MLIRALAMGAILAAGCTSLPEPESPGAQAFARRCGECHRAYSPGSMTWPMWEYQLDRMRVLFAQLRRPWLSPEEEALVTDYLKRHAGGRS
jgi:diheme cytochrome c